MMEQKTLDKIKIVAMLGLIITMATLAFVIFKYGSLIKQDPCSLCQCTIDMLKGGLR